MAGELRAGFLNPGELHKAISQPERQLRLTANARGKLRILRVQRLRQRDDCHLR